jgi:hypothetical protein
MEIFRNRRYLVSLQRITHDKLIRQPETSSVRTLKAELWVSAKMTGLGDIRIPYGWILGE